MTTLTATALPTLAAVRLEILGAADGAVTLTRSDANGTAPVRLLEDQEPIGGSLVVTDYEPALTGTLTYSVTDSAAVTVSDTADLTGLVAHPVLVSPVRPQHRVDLVAVTDYSHSRESNATVHPIIERTDPIVIYGGLRTRQGTVNLYAPSYAEALAIEDVFDSGEVALLRQTDHDGMDAYMIAERTSVSVFQGATVERRWQVAVEFVEAVVDAPLLGGAGWTYADLLENYPTVFAVANAFTDFNDLAVGP